jgi:hypothetical protein
VKEREKKVNKVKDDQQDLGNDADTSGLEIPPPVPMSMKNLKGSGNRSPGRTRRERKSRQR